jgi:Ca2+-binding RTX toxin-like protein
MRIPAICVALLASAAVVPEVASAATTVTYAAASGVTVTGDADVTQVSAATNGNVATIVRPFGARSVGAPLQAGTGCSGTADTVSCTIPAGGVGILTFSGGDGNDLYFGFFFSGDQFLGGGNGDDNLAGGVGFDALNGGAGNDTLAGRGGNDQVRGGPDNDVLNDQTGDDVYLGEAGDDAFIAESVAGGADAYRGGTGFDSLSYAARSSAVNINPSDREAPSGGGDGAPAIGSTPAENDAVFDDVESWTGGSGNDSFSASGTRIRTMKGGPGNDVLSATSTSLDITLDGGTGQDVLRGGLGGDNLRSRDGEADTVSCSSGFDFATVDLRDLPLSSNAACESVNSSDRREGPNVDVLTRTAVMGAGGRVRIRLSCPRALRRLGCRGTLRLGPRSPRTRYAIRSGHRATVVAVVAARDRRAKLQLVSVEKGDWGPKTTRRLLPVRRT